MTHEIGIADLIFWLTLFLLVYTYVGYSLVIALLSQLRSNPVKRDADRGGPFRLD